MDAKRLKLDEENVPVPTCKHFVKRKKRFCKMTVAKGKEYCGEHAEVTSTENESENRIPCPLDPKHTVYSKNLRKHLKICNARPKEMPSYIVPNINIDSSQEAATESEQVKLSDISPEVLKELIDKVEKFYQTFIVGKIEKLCFQHDILSAELENKEYGNETRKHLLQTSSILGCLEHLGMLKDSTSFIEFGAGKGQVSYWLARAIENFKESNVILVDRASHRHKKDNKLEDKNCVHRIRADIANFEMRKFDLLRDTKQSVAVSKHLCGAATDLALKCIVQGQLDSEEFPSIRTEGFLIALCCHHRCEWGPFVGKSHFENIGLSKSDFNLITKMASWAICGSGMSRERRKQIEESGGVADSANEDKHKMSIERRADIGKMCKRLLDYCRLQYMQDNGFKCDLKYYVESSVTLENVCLIGQRI